eukprot:scaffold22613_cov126-Cylindrotheca_fusiformis.AAC.6
MSRTSILAISMKIPLLCLLLVTGGAEAFSFQASTQGGGLVSVDERTQRDVVTMNEWALSCGVQTSEGFELTTNDGLDYCVMTQQDLPVGSPVLYVPSEMVLSSVQAVQEFGTGTLGPAEQELLQSGKVDAGKIPLFRIFAKILVEYEKGQASPWYPWLNSTPRLYNTGASMTYACFDCLPPYAAGLAMQERVQSVNFQKAAKLLPLRLETLSNVDLLKWAYNVAVTRSMEWNGAERFIAPMADMFNHGTETEVELSFDENGNCMAYATRDVPAGSELRLSYGDPTNPSPLFATYGFLDESSPATFCKLMHLTEEMEELGYDFSNLLFYKDTGDISMEVYDVILYSILRKNDPNLAQGFYQAVLSGDVDTKNQFHEQYFAYTKEELQKHVDGTLRNLEKWSSQAESYDPITHPRVPVILKHNSFVKESFLRVKQNLDSM